MARTLTRLDDENVQAYREQVRLGHCCRQLEKMSRLLHYVS